MKALRTILLLGHTDLRLFLRNKSSYIWLFVAPLLFIAFMGFANRGPGKPGNVKPRIRIENADTNFLSAIFIKELGSHGIEVLETNSTEEAVRTIRIPPDFSARILAGEQAKAQLLGGEQSVSSEGAMVELRLLRAVVAMNSHLLLAASTNAERIADSSVRENMERPATVLLDAKFAGRKPSPVGFNFSLPGNMVMYVMMNLLLFGGISLVIQRQNGVVRRMACNPVSRAQMVAGKIYGLTLLGIVQVSVFLLAGQFLFGVHLGSNLGPVLLTMCVYAWVAASLGVLIGSLVQDEDKVVGISIMASLVMAAIGGCWWPLEIVPAGFRAVAYCVPSGWALDALHQLLTFGGGLADAAKDLGILAAFGLAANALAATFFKW